jgi:hypothetical protein
MMYITALYDVPGLRLGLDPTSMSFVPPFLSIGFYLLLLHLSYLQKKELDTFLLLCATGCRHEYVASHKHSVLFGCSFKFVDTWVRIWVRLLGSDSEVRCLPDPVRAYASWEHENTPSGDICSRSSLRSSTTIRDLQEFDRSFRAKYHTASTGLKRH